MKNDEINEINNIVIGKIAINRLPVSLVFN